MAWYVIMQSSKYFFAKLSTSDLSNKTLVESNPKASTLLTSTTPLALTIVDEEEWEHLFHTQIWVQNNPLLLIVDNGIQKKFVSKDFLNKIGLVTTPHLLCSSSICFPYLYLRLIITFDYLWHTILVLNVTSVSLSRFMNRLHG